MAKLDPKDFSLHVAREIQAVLKEFRNLENENSDIVESV